MIPNIQKIIDNHIFKVLNEEFGKDATGGNWIDDPSQNVKNKYSIKREYRTVQINDVENLIKGATNSNYGVMLVANTRIVKVPRSLKKISYITESQTLIYLIASSIRTNQSNLLEDTSRITYDMVTDVSNAIIEKPLPIINYNLPFELRTFESELSNTDIDIQRLLLVIPNIPT